MKTIHHSTANILATIIILSMLLSACSINEIKAAVEQPSTVFLVSPNNQWVIGSMELPTGKYAVGVGQLFPNNNWYFTLNPATSAFNSDRIVAQLIRDGFREVNFWDLPAPVKGFVVGTALEMTFSYSSSFMFFVPLSSFDLLPTHLLPIGPCSSDGNKINCNL